MKKVDMENFIANCKHACGLKAQEFGLSPEVGHHIHDACVAEDLNGWSKQEFINWVEFMHLQYRSIEDTLLQKLYVKCSKVMSEYAERVLGNF